MSWIRLTLISVAMAISGCADTSIIIEQREMTESQRAEFVNAASIAISTDYLYAGRDLDGMDCSGLIVFSYRQLGYGLFLIDSGPALDANSDELFRLNGAHIFSYSNLTPGDLIFFDQNYDGRMDHVAIFIEDGATGPVVLDAHSVSGIVSTRVIEGMWGKNPHFARPLIISGNSS